jgi:hypothetical protein
MDAGVVSGFRPQAFASRTAAERVKTGAWPRGAFEISRLPVAKRPPQPKVSALRRPESPQAAKDAPRHRPRRASLHPAPRRSQRRLTPFFSSLLRCSSPPTWPFGQVLARPVTDDSWRKRKPSAPGFEALEFAGLPRVSEPLSISGTLINS